MSNMRGEITLTPRLPRLGDVFRSFFTQEARIRPYYNGTGSILLQPSLGGYHVVEVPEGETWILEPGVYWASSGTVAVPEMKSQASVNWAAMARNSAL